MSSDGFFPIRGSKVSDSRATASCYCGTVQLEFPTEGPDLTDVFICNCYDCYKITASVFASNFSVKDKSLKHLKGEDKLSKFNMVETIGTKNTMTNYFCSVCGSLMYRRTSGIPGESICRIGSIDDFSLMETKLKPWREQFVHSRTNWVLNREGISQYQGNPLKDGVSGM